LVILAGQKMSPTSHILSDSRRSTPSSKLYAVYSDEILRIACGPNRVPERYVVPISNGAPRNATSYSPTFRTSSRYGIFRNVLMPDQCGSSPRWKQLISVLSSIESAHGSPSSFARRHSASHCAVGSAASSSCALYPEYPE